MYVIAGCWVGASRVDVRSHNAGLFLDAVGRTGAHLDTEIDTFRLSSSCCTTRDDDYGHHQHLQKQLTMYDTTTTTAAVAVISNLHHHRACHDN